MDPPVPTILSIQAESRNGIPVVTVAGEIDLSTAPRLAEAMKRALVPGAPLIVNLAGVEFIDSAGTHALAVADHAATEGGGRLLIVTSEFVARVLEVSGLDRAFRLHGELREALAAAAEPER
jgi:anti-sigma B factor antagonist